MILKNESFVFDLLLSLTIILLVAGCGTMRAYDNPNLSPEEIATIKPEFRLLSTWTGKVLILNVDGKDLVLYKNVAVAPGMHSLDVSISWGFPNGGRSTTIQLLAEAGHEYIVKAEGKGFTVRTWEMYIVDSKTDQIVAGPKSAF